jgi:hypothetical protein
MQIRERILHQRADLMRPHVLWLATGFLVLAEGATGQVDLPGPVQRGLDALRHGHYDDVGKEWAGSRTTANATGSPQQVTSSFKTFGAVAGPLVGYDVVKVLDVTPHIKRVYIALLYKTQPAYLMLVVYRPGNESVVTTLTWNTDPDKVFPPSVVPLQRPGGSG